METSEPALFCDLGALDPEERQVVAQTEAQLKAAVKAVEDLPDGLQFVFPGQREVLETVCRWLPMETACCPFLNFELIVPEKNGPIRLRMTGREGVKTFLKQELA